MTQVMFWLSVLIFLVLLLVGAFVSVAFIGALYLIDLALYKLGN